VASVTTISNGGQGGVYGSAVSAIIRNGGMLQVNSGGAASSLTVSSGGLDTIFSGGAASGSILRGGLELLSGGTATATVVSSGGGQGVTRNGVAFGTVVSSGGEQALGGSGTPIATSTTVLSGGLLVVGTGVAVSAVVSNGGSASVNSLGNAKNTTVFSGGEQDVGGTASGTILSGGLEMVTGSGAVQLLALVDSTGQEFVGSGGDLVSATMSGGAVVIDNGALLGNITMLPDAFSVVEFNSTGNLGGEVSGFDTSDTIDFRGVAFTAGVTALSWTQLSSSGTLTVASAGARASLTLLGQYAGQTMFHHQRPDQRRPHRRRECIPDLRRHRRWHGCGCHRRRHYYRRALRRRCQRHHRRQRRGFRKSSPAAALAGPRSAAAGRRSYHLAASPAERSSATAACKPSGPAARRLTPSCRAGVCRTSWP
jgi:autotransporter passenger strand-loop-strand repeat protein